MSTYVIGDVQGCADQLFTLLKVIEFNPKEDQIWLTGDLANRGPKPLEALKFIHSLDAICVLGNHDIALLAALCEIITLPPDDPAQIILGVPIVEKQKWIDWLRHLPLLHHDHQLGVVMSHAGIYPKWDIQQATQLAHEVEHALRGDHYREFLSVIYGDEPNKWDTQLSGIDRMRFILNTFTRMRFVTADGTLVLHAKRTPKDHPEYFPWFSMPNRIHIEDTLIFGHWSALKGHCPIPNIYALDEGCVWGGSLCALCLETRQRTSVSG